MIGATTTRLAPLWVRMLMVTISLLLVGSSASSQESRPRPERHVEIRESARAREVKADPSEWFRGEKEMSRSERDTLWEHLDRQTRIRVSERIGERQMEREIERQKFERICSTRAASDRPQGFDAVVRSGDIIIVAESKSTAQRGRIERPEFVERLMGNGYGERQGTLEWAKKAAEATRDSKTANWREKRAAEEVLAAHQEGRLAVVVFVTQHQRGTVTDRKMIQTAGPAIH